jgi:hypothetical protein
MTNSSDNLREYSKQLNPLAVSIDVESGAQVYQCSGHPIQVFLQLRMHIVQALFPLSHAVFLKFP